MITVHHQRLRRLLHLRLSFPCKGTAGFSSESSAMIEDDRFIAWRGISAAAASNAEKVSYLTVDSDMAPFSMAAWGGDGAQFHNADPTASVYGLVIDGTAMITNSNATFPLLKGMYFSCPGQCTLSGGAGIAITAPNRKPLPSGNLPPAGALDEPSRMMMNHAALFAVGGPIFNDESSDEGVGRLPYIDGCSDTLLVAPVVKGAPCLNHLHFPPNIEQTQHTHPSGRAGVVLRGRGRCVVELQGESGVERIVTPLEPGTAFVIPAHLTHAFETTAAPGEDDETLDVFAFHPDSDFGPAPSDHPMVNRTVVDGVSASLLPDLQTK